MIQTMLGHSLITMIHVVHEYLFLDPVKDLDLIG